MPRAYLNYGLVAAVVVWAAVIGMMAYRLDGSKWRWAFIVLMFLGGLTIAAIFWIRKFVDRHSKASEQGSQE
jgi:F0F1-type ATP synthase assembly protein I